MEKEEIMRAISISLGACKIQHKMYTERGDRDMVLINTGATAALEMLLETISAEPMSKR